MGFSKDFKWGVASAAYQIEGAYNEDGKGLSIWDVYAGKDGHTQYNEDGKVACDHYHRVDEDVDNMAKLGILYYRFSIAWTRILPEGTGAINEKGIQFYSDLVDKLLAKGIEPMVTLFHWDYPYALHKKGSWLNDESPEWFLEYVQVVIDALSDRVSHWITFNEPQCMLGCGHLYGVHAPFEKLSSGDLLQMGRNILLAHGKAVRYIRNYAKKKPIIGYAPVGPCFIPENDSEEAIALAKKKTFAAGHDAFSFSVSYWSDPIFLGDYPKDLYEKYGELVPRFTEEEKKLVTEPLDFYGSNIYYSNADVVTDTCPNNRYQGSPETAMEWPVTPEVLYWAPKFLYERYGKPILISENGMAGPDWVHLDGKVHDSYRIDFTQRYLREYKKAAEEGIPLVGYMYWSIMDNYEWDRGYSKRFGLIYVDYRTQERVIKDSGYWYQSVIACNGENL